jgi:hypothetical protein
MSEQKESNIFEIKLPETISAIRATEYIQEEIVKNGGLLASTTANAIATVIIQAEKQNKRTISVGLQFSPIAPYILGHFNLSDETTITQQIPIQPQTKKNYRRIVAREGLILLLFLLISFIIYQLSGIIADLCVKVKYSYITKEEVMLLEALHDYADSRVKVFSCLLYPLFWLIRFTIWAIRTLRQR